MAKHYFFSAQRASGLWNTILPFTTRPKGDKADFLPMSQPRLTE
jgi:hypothetical protein